MSKIVKTRLDLLLVESGLADSRSKAQALIMAGEVMVDGEMRDKPGIQVPSDSNITIKQKLKYVSRGGLKIEPALTEFGLSPSEKTCLDVGASTGGFTDLLLQNGAEKVYAVDVGKGQLDWNLRNDDRVVVLEGTNARYLDDTHIPEKVDIVTIDVSFISLKLILPPVISLLKPSGIVLALVKPQFEAGKDKVGKGGVVRDLEIINDCVDNISSFAEELDLTEKGRLPSPVKGPKGNQEWVLFLSKTI
jgi:23S rRNA (cytidine1920-2'-O)/16S rRNA (cytidine1409-2'-O)-methyltransferase